MMGGGNGGRELESFGWRVERLIPDVCEAGRLRAARLPTLEALMTQLSVTQVSLLMGAVDPFMHFVLIAGLVLILFEVVILLGDLVGSRDREIRR